LFEEKLSGEELFREEFSFRRIVGEELFKEEFTERTDNIRIFI
jgi:hypothetical protein